MSLNNSGLSRRRLTVATVTHNSATGLAATLASIGSIADEVVVVDANSTDETRLVAAEHGARLLGSSWTSDLSDLRNYAWENASGEWLLWLEPGEVLAPDAIEPLRRFVDTDADVAKVYMLLVQLSPCQGERHSQQIGRIRLVPNYSTLRFSGRHGDDLKAAIGCTGLGLEGIPWRILRPADDHEPRHKRKQARRSLVLSQLELESAGPNCKLLNRIGESLAAIDDHAAAVATFRKAVSFADPSSTDMLEAYYGLLSALDHDPAVRAQQIDLCLNALVTFPCDAQLLCAMGNYLQSQGQNELAARAFETAYRYGQVNPELWHLSDIVELAASCSALAWQVAGKHDQARSLLEDAVQSCTTSDRLCRQLVDLYIGSGRREDAVRQAQVLSTGSSDRERLRTAVRGACLAAQEQWQQALTYLQMAYGAGCRDPICLRWLTIALLSTGDVERSEPILSQWLRCEPDNLEAQKYLDALQKPNQCANIAASRAGQQYRVDASSEHRPVSFAHYADAAATAPIFQR